MIEIEGKKCILPLQTVQAQMRQLLQEISHLCLHCLQILVNLGLALQGLSAHKTWFKPPVILSLTVPRRSSHFYPLFMIVLCFPTPFLSFIDTPFLFICCVCRWSDVFVVSKYLLLVTGLCQCVGRLPVTFYECLFLLAS